MHMPVQRMVAVGSRVRLSDRDEVAEYVIAPEHEVDAAAGRISANSPLGKAVLGHRSGDEVAVRAPGGLRRVAILDVG